MEAAAGLSRQDFQLNLYCKSVDYSEKKRNCYPYGGPFCSLFSANNMRRFIKNTKSKLRIIKIIMKKEIRQS
jgi:hypothetical protein